MQLSRPVEGTLLVSFWASFWHRFWIDVGVDSCGFCTCVCVCVCVCVSQILKQVMSGDMHLDAKHMAGSNFLLSSLIRKLMRASWGGTNGEGTKLHTPCCKFHRGWRISQRLLQESCPTEAPTPKPTADPTPDPTEAPTPQPTAERYNAIQQTCTGRLVMSTIVIIQACITRQHMGEQHVVFPKLIVLGNKVLWA